MRMVASQSKSLTLSHMFSRRNTSYRGQYINCLELCNPSGSETAEHEACSEGCSNMLSTSLTLVVPVVNQKYEGTGCVGFCYIYEKWDNTASYCYMKLVPT